MDSTYAEKVIFKDGTELSDVTITEHEIMRGFLKITHADGKLRWLTHSVSKG
jgi:hypothetical protein